MILPPGEVRKRIDERRAGVTPDPSPTSQPAQRWRHFRPLTTVVDDVVADSTETRRILFGIEEIDQQMRGVTPGAVCLIVGYAHAGKTLVGLHLIRANRHKRVLLLTPDEPASLVLTKLVCAQHRINPVAFEQRLTSGDPDAIGLLRSTCEDDFPTLAVIDSPLGSQETCDAFDEACDAWGAPPDLVMFDYLELFNFAPGEGVKQQIRWIKQFAMHYELPAVVIHQSSRAGGTEGRRIGLSSGAFGGEQEATFLVGVRRKKFEIAAKLRELETSNDTTGRVMEAVSSLRHELTIHEHTVTINMPKNKRPGGRTVDDFDMEIDATCGRLLPLRNADLPRQYLEQQRRQWI